MFYTSVISSKLQNNLLLAVPKMSREYLEHEEAEMQHFHKECFTTNILASSVIAHKIIWH